MPTSRNTRATSVTKAPRSTRKTSTTGTTEGTNTSPADDPPRAALPALGPLTVSGPSAPLAVDATADAGPHAAAVASMKAAAQEMAAARPHNAGKRAEHGLAHATRPPAGEHQEPGDPIGGASTLTEDTASAKLGSGEPPMGENTTIGSLDAVRVDAAGQAITTNHGVAVADNQSSLKAGLRGPTLLEDFILREKITHFDHERIPERVVHARGSAAHGVFECYEDLSELTRASLFSRAGKQTPVFVRFSTVAGERGSADAVRDTRGFAVKFYTPEGNWDLVGNNIPVFFIQDAMKFPDLVHAVKPEPHHAMPQASSAHDTFWDFVSLMPESIHHVMWVMSDRGIPRSYRTMPGFGVHAFRFVNERGESRFVKFHWLPLAGTHSLVWDEAVKVNGADPDFHRRDLWEAIEAGNFPEYELAIQVVSEAEAETFSFDILDPTKIVPEELVPLRTIGKLTLNRNPDNFFAETEQVAFCTANIVPGIDFSNDPLLQGRNHSYLDTQLSRLGGPNFQQLPINMPLAPVFNNQRDAMHQHQVHRGRVNYEPNSLAGGCPHQAGMRGFASYAATGMRARADGEGTSEDKVRGKPEKFADHYSQAQLFWRSQSAVEQRHLAAALRFELSRATVPAIRERMVSVLLNVDPALAAQVGEGLGLVKMPAPQPLASERAVTSEVEASPGLSLFARPGDGRIAGRRIALIAADGVEASSLRAVQQALTAQQAVASVVGCRLGALRAADGEAIEADTSVEALPSVLWDALVLPAGAEALPELTADGRVVEFVRDQYRHCKTILVLGGDTVLLEAAGVSRELIDEGADPGLIVATPADENEGAEEAETRALQAFVAAVAKHRHFERELDPPAV